MSILWGFKNIFLYPLSVSYIHEYISVMIIVRIFAAKTLKTPFRQIENLTDFILLLLLVVMGTDLSSVQHRTTGKKKHEVLRTQRCLVQILKLFHINVQRAKAWTCRVRCHRLFMALLRKESKLPQDSRNSQEVVESLRPLSLDFLNSLWESIPRNFGKLSRNVIYYWGDAELHACQIAILGSKRLEWPRRTSKNCWQEQ